jgi:hypothetical protein
MSERGGGISLPGAPAQTPGLPENFSPILFEQFETLNTKPLRPGIRDPEMSWIDGWMPIGPNNARVLWGTGDTLFSATQGVVWFGFGNIATTNYCYALLANGELVAINMQTSAGIVVMPAGTVNNPRSVFGFSQWGSQYAIFAIDQVNGYWLWDGTNLYGAGTIGPVVTIDNGGQSYNASPNYAVETTGGGSGVQLSFTIQNGAVTQGTVVAPGSGFGLNDFIGVTVSGGGSDDQAVCALPIIRHQAGGLVNVFVVDGGHGYTGFAYVEIQDAITGGSGGARLSLSVQNGTITGVAIVDAGQGFETTPTFIVIDPGIPGTPPVPGGSGGEIGGAIAYGQITNIPVTYGGTGYVSPPTVVIQGDGINAAGIAQIQNGVVVDIFLTNKGSGYTKALVTLTGGNDAANVSLALMPFGVSGTAVEVYENHVWIANGAAVAKFPPPSRVIFSDPNSPVGFGNGGGAFESTDAFLRVGYHALRQSNGFLYLIGDSSLNYISGVQTSSSGTASVPAIPVTTFGNLNVDPQIGTPWPGSVQVFSRNIVFANTVGVQVSYGGAVKKVSDALDGFYATGDIFGQQQNFSSAVAHIFAIPVYMLLLPVVAPPGTPTAGDARHKLLMWDGKRWFTSQQDQELRFIATYEQNSVLTAYGTDGTNIFPLFAEPSTGFLKVIQSKLFSQPAYFTTKQSRSLSGIVNYYDADKPLTVTVDSEAGLGTGNASIPITQTGNGVVWTNNAGALVAWTNNVAAAVIWGTQAALVVFGPYPVGQQGRLIGMTAMTHGSDMAILSLMLADTVESPNV